MCTKGVALLLVTGQAGRVSGIFSMLGFSRRRGRDLERSAEETEKCQCHARLAHAGQPLSSALRLQSRTGTQALFCELSSTASSTRNWRIPSSNVGYSTGALLSATLL